MRAALLALVTLCVCATPVDGSSAAPLEQRGTLLVATFGAGQALAPVLNERLGLEGELYAIVEGVQAGRDYFVLADGPRAIFEVVFPCDTKPGLPRQAGVVPCDGAAYVFMMVGEPGSGYYYLEA